MINKRKEIKSEIEKLQDFINHCETARNNGLGLDEKTYNKYTEALERQRELGDQLTELELNGKGLFTSAQLLRKE